MSEYIFSMTCPDSVGIVASVTEFIASYGGFIECSSHYGDSDTNNFFMRTVFKIENKTKEELAQKFRAIGEKFKMKWNFYDSQQKPKVLIGVSKFGHCLNDLLHKYRSELLPVEIAAVFSNHENKRKMVEWYNIPYYYLPVTQETKKEQESQILDLIKKYDTDFVVLARYMQILSPELCKELKGRAINIHHSFLPGFKGAAPYAQAYKRGVKIIGATAHYVTEDLDEGPIIEQATERVSHSSSVDDIAHTCRDLETMVLSRAVKWHAERRVLLNGAKTVVF